MKICRFGDYLKQQFGEKVYKVPLDGGFTCPNIDGTKGRGGCIYCNNDSFRPDYVSRLDSLEQQMEKGVEIFRRKGAGKFLGYFQSYTNTYAPVDELRTLYRRVLSFDDVVGLCVGTRPDCVDQADVELFASLADEGHEIWLELGQQTLHEQTLDVTNRCHGTGVFHETIARCRPCSNLNICVHVMFGLPGERKREMKQTVRELADVNPDGIKFHQLQVVKGTELAKWYQRGEYQPMTYEEYADLVRWSLEELPEDVVVHRLMGDTTGDYLLAPRWDETKHELYRWLADPEPSGVSS